MRGGCADLRTKSCDKSEIKIFLDPHGGHTNAAQHPHEGRQLTITSHWPHVILTKATWHPYWLQAKIWAFRGLSEAAAA